MATTQPKTKRGQRQALALHISPRQTDDISLFPKRQEEALTKLAKKAKQRLRTRALFSGPSGTGKTSAVEFLARKLQVTLYRIDLGAVVSKYIGETEKNLRRLFDEAEDSSAILFFDEADALFGKRSEVKDSHDRYANLALNFLCDRVKKFQGLIILSCKRHHALDMTCMPRIQCHLWFRHRTRPLAKRNNRNSE
jgi:SpoVK/Ycf46/Vps4 family AAA+-type ATPase